MEILFKGLPLRPTRSAYHEMKDLGMDLFDVIKVLEEGYDCAAGKRRRGTIERCLDTKGKTTKAVAAKSHEHWSGQEVYVLVHVGRLARKRK
jgi:hypothetical protein